MTVAREIDQAPCDLDLALGLEVSLQLERPDAEEVGASARPPELAALAPAFEHHADLPVVTGGGLRATVILGELDGAASPDKELRVYDRMQHEIFNERDRDRSIGDAVAWLSERAPREGAKWIDAPRG